MNLRGLCGIVAGTAVAHTALAREGPPVWRWQVSADAGTTWRDGVVEVAFDQQSVRVRALVGWTRSPSGAYAFAGSMFDVAVQGPPGNADLIALSDAPGQGRMGLGWSYAQTLVASRLGDMLKIDDSRDSLPPGWGTRGVLPGQLVEMYAGTNFTHANPAVIFEYTLLLDGSPGARLIGDEFIPRPECIRRYFNAYTSPDGRQHRFGHDPCIPSGEEIDYSPAEVVVAECPADFNHDRQVDLFDYLDFAAAFAAMDAAADFNNDGRVDFFDYLDFAGAFDAGCE